jgi:hypothetical protein
MPRGLSRLFLSRRQAAVLQGEAQAMGMEGAKRRKGQGTGAKILKNGINLGSSALGGVILACVDGRRDVHLNRMSVDSG